ncbi:hypothetical protein DYB26_004840 [Aphanomyces astaci]|uniref:U4/U6.U5 tri-snRNP-associated protein 1 n=1 Tax=Aphanomyces astaci TaxID=112090 RepID=A0A418FX48_APHAT|nr:hypothetical protein DYB26_004840 [Aphanomyces astaci]
MARSRSPVRHRSRSPAPRHRSRSPGRNRSRSRGRYDSGRKRDRGREPDKELRDVHRPKRVRKNTDDNDDLTSKGKPSTASSSSTVDAKSSSSAPAVISSSDKNGEISMTIDETNKLRISMGLKPLRLTNASKEKEVNLSKSREDVAEEARQKALTDALAKSKQKRQFTEKLKGQSLGETLKQADGGRASALDWVRQSRTKKAAAPASSAPSASTYGAADLKGLTVAHDARAFDEGDEVILTLKDQRVLTDDRNDVNDGGDELENVDMRDEDRRLEREARLKRASGPVYSGFDDDEFTTILGPKKATKKPVRLLAQYDEDEDMAALRDANKFALSDTGSHLVEAIPQRDVDDDKVSVSLASHKKQYMEEYFTTAELAIFSKKKSKKLRKKKQKMRQRDDDDFVQQLEADAVSQTTTTTDHGKRRFTTKEGDAGGDDVAARDRFERARHKANVKAQAMVERMKEQHAEEDDDELGASLARSRRLALVVAATATAKEEDNDRRVLLQVSGMSQGSHRGGDAAATSGHQYGHIHKDDPSSGGENTTMVFGESTDFDVRVKNAMDERDAARAAAAAAVSGGGKHRGGPVTTVEEDVDDDQEGKKPMVSTVEDEEEEEEDEESSWGVDEPLVQTGMAATLALLRNRGDLRDAIQIRQAGRANDHRERHVEEELQIKDGVKLDYRDEFGRLLTKKEAFRRISYRFHGHTPGKKKQEKRLKQIKEELAQQKNLGNVVGRMETLDKRQKVAKQAHVVLSGK